MSGYLAVERKFKIGQVVKCISNYSGHPSLIIGSLYTLYKEDGSVCPYFKKFGTNNMHICAYNHDFKAYSPKMEMLKKKMLK